ACGATTEASGGCGAQADPNGVSCPNGGSIVTVALTAGQTVRVMAGGYYSYTGRGLLSLTVKPSTSTAPTVTRIAATAGPTTGGVPVTLYGSNFASGMTATFGGTGATGVSVLTPNIATAIAPAHAAGAVDVAVTNTDLQSGRLLSAYTYVTCAISLSPPSASVASGGGIATSAVTATAGCGWTAVSNASWIQTSSYGIGNGTLSYSVVANLSTVARSGTITVGDQTFTVNQSGVLPTNLVATATTTTSVTLTWTASSVNHFEVWRASGGAFALIASPTAAGYTDNTPLANTTYVYKVRAVDGGAAFSAYSNNDIATTILFTDDPLVPFSTVIKAVHIARLRDALNAVRAAAGFGAAPVTDPSLTGVRVKAVHITELRAPLDLARSMLGVPALSYSSVVSGGTVKALAVTELRDGVK
ncbi:MAG: IPT/TIG domain-containing protein, partial [Acidobacteriota bacterium]